MTNKYTTALALFQKTVDAGKDIEQANTCFDKLLEHLHANFEAPQNSDENLKGCREILEKTVPEEDIFCSPPKVSDDLYPVALSKSILCKHQLHIDSTKLTQFDTFHKRYGDLILISMSQK